MARGDKPYLRKSTDRKAQIRKAFVQFRGLICALRSVDFSGKVYHPEPPHAQYLFLFPIVFGINSFIKQTGAISAFSYLHYVSSVRCEHAFPHSSEKRRRIKDDQKTEVHVCMQTETPNCYTCRTAQRGGVAGCQTTNTFQTMFHAVVHSLFFHLLFLSLFFPSCFYTKKKKKKMHGEKLQKKHYASLKISSLWYPMKN